MKGLHKAEPVERFWSDYWHVSLCKHCCGRITHLPAGQGWGWGWIHEDGYVTADGRERTL